MMPLVAQELGPLVDWAWVGRHLDDIRAQTLEHVILTAIALGAGMAISLPLAILAARKPRALPPITWFAGLLYTIPSIALFALLVPVTGLTMLTAEIGLTSYTLLILIRNIHAGLASVPAPVREAALAMGYTRSRMLWRVEMPLALPVIVAGLRIATVTTIGLVTVTSLIAYGGLGRFIYDGLQRFFNTPLIVGSALSIALALAADVLLLGAQRALTPWARARRAA